MKNKFIKIFLLAILFSPVIFLIPKVDAQTGDCDVVVVTTRTTQPLGDSFFDEDSRPYFYIDISTQNCMNDIGALEVSITESDPGGNDDIAEMDDLEINVTSATTNNFTLALIAGEDECDSMAGLFDCKYHIETFDDVDDFEWPQVSEYECDGVCNLDWEYLGVIAYGATHPNDPDNLNNSNNANPDGLNSGGTGEAITEIELNLVNPISNSVGSIPQFLQKVIDIIIKIAIPFTAIVLVYCGLLFVTARGDTSQIEKARHAFTYAVIGGLVLLSSWLIAEAIRDALTSIAYVL